MRDFLGGGFLEVHCFSLNPTVIGFLYIQNFSKHVSLQELEEFFIGSVCLTAENTRSYSQRKRKDFAIPLRLLCALRG